MENRKSSCDSCLYYVYDEDYDCYICQMDMDEDELARFLTDQRSQCPYYRLGDDYSIVRKQM